ncbi:2Fe-2S iron-sulfur cluster-binding protein [Gilvimarinus polysaccharolyticus]|uniref:2Fe-2S iron-sulfur cluster-binding protein n=1 Tax=Gilvimarinus polysaccharolyticus TaxID=863921 RepID=UPI0006739465|nr:2Fe-2S iron-sulfur cluster binding domain-containing protein [Gilvimarinus polysaccharolyticus]
MTTIIYNHQSLEVSPGESALDTLLSAGVNIPYSCRVGVCQSCLITLKQGNISSDTQAGLSAEQKAQGLLLSCRCYPTETITLEHYDPSANGISARLIDKQLLNNSVLELTLDVALKYQAGQHTNLWRSQAIARCYSLASIPSDPYVKFHIALQPNGQFSQWANDSLQVGDQLTLQQPTGDCYFQADHANQPLLLVGTGTGIAPLQAIVRAALHAEHQGAINLIVGARNSDDLYFSEQLKQLEQQHANVQCTQLVQKVGQKNAAHCQQGDIYAHLKQHFNELNAYQVYLCGAESFVRKLRKQCFFAGARPCNVHIDAFIAAN